MCLTDKLMSTIVCRHIIQTHNSLHATRIHPHIPPGPHLKIKVDKESKLLTVNRHSLRHIASEDSYGTKDNSSKPYLILVPIRTSLPRNG